MASAAAEREDAGATAAALAQELCLPELPSMDNLETWAPGPHGTCNYLLPGRVLAGSFPGDRSEPGHTEKVRSLLAAGVDTFLCLQERDELQRFTPYIETAWSLSRASETEVLSRIAAPASGETEGSMPLPLEFWSCPIPDTHITSPDALGTAIATLVEKLQEGRVIYVHCWGGHGRTGTLLCAFLVVVYGLTTEEAKNVFMKTHGMRRTRGGQWPHSSAQYQQVKDFEGTAALSSKRLAPLDDWTFAKQFGRTDARRDFCLELAAPRGDDARKDG